MDTFAHPQASDQFRGGQNIQILRVSASLSCPSILPRCLIAVDGMSERLRTRRNRKSVWLISHKSESCPGRRNRARMHANRHKLRENES